MFWSGQQTGSYPGHKILRARIEIFAEPTSTNRIRIEGYLTCVWEWASCVFTNESFVSRCSGKTCKTIGVYLLYPISQLPFVHPKTVSSSTSHAPKFLKTSIPFFFGLILRWFLPLFFSSVFSSSFLLLSLLVLNSIQPSRYIHD